MLSSNLHIDDNFNSRLGQKSSTLSSGFWHTYLKKHFLVLFKQQMLIFITITKFEFWMWCYIKAWARELFPFVMYFESKKILHPTLGKCTWIVVFFPFSLLMILYEVFLFYKEKVIKLLDGQTPVLMCNMLEQIIGFVKRSKWQPKWDVFIAMLS